MHLTELDLLKLFVSLIIGGVIGAEREYRSKSAGFRTIILITMGSTLFTIFSIQIGSAGSADRIASNIVTGIGFLGAGVIFREGSRVSGITTATTIWIAAALGMGVGGGYFLICIITTGIVLLVLYGFTLLERYIDSASQTRNYRIVCNYENQTLLYYEEVFKNFKLHSYRGKQTKEGNIIEGNWIVYGPERNHEKAINELLKDQRITEFDF
jgi:putative Mg2+ transporter-C (MgtC) family protein